MKKPRYVPQLSHNQPAPLSRVKVVQTEMLWQSRAGKFAQCLAHCVWPKPLLSIIGFHKQEINPEKLIRMKSVNAFFKNGIK